MTKKILMGIMTKSHKNRNLIYGPNYSLTVDQTKCIVNYLKSKGLWNYDYLTNNACIIPNDVLINELKLFPKEFYDNRYLYDFSFCYVNNYFALESVILEIATFSIAFIDLNTEERYASWLLSESQTSKIIDYLTCNNEYLDNKPIEKTFMQKFFKNKFDYYFNNKINVTIEVAELSDYIFYSNENWFKIKENIGFVDLNWIAGSK